MDGENRFSSALHGQAIRNGSAEGDTRAKRNLPWCASWRGVGGVVGGKVTDSAGGAIHFSLDLCPRRAGAWPDRPDGSHRQGSGSAGNECPGALPQAGMERALGAEMDRTLRPNSNRLTINALHLCSRLLHNWILLVIGNFHRVHRVSACWSSFFNAARVSAIWARSFSYSGRR